jgi:hypothetical protein
MERPYPFRVRRIGIALLLLIAASPALTRRVHAQRFLPDDPVLEDRDDLPIPPPREIELATAYDVIEHTFHHRPGKAKVPPAQNVNTLGEVPDSSWWTNRIGTRPMSIEELVRGANDGEGPDLSRPLDVIRGKSGGITPGFTVKDARGDLYFVKFDPSSHFGLATGAEVVASKFFHAMGYFVPTNWVVYFRRDQLRIAPGATVRVRGGKPRPMAAQDLDDALGDVARLPDGRIRAVASRAVPGLVVGPHKYHGTRPDDPNDVIPHEHRRELRGYRVFSAWLNHDDSRSINSIDSYVRGERGSSLVHYMQDFSSSLGAGSDWARRIAPQNPRSGNEYILALGPAVKTAFTLGIWERPWFGIEYEVHPQVGRIEAERFDPHLWKPEYPNPAFERMQPADAFWAARIVSKFTDDAIAAIVREGDFRAPEAEAHLARVIRGRRDKVVARYLGDTNPIAEFSAAEEAAGATLRFVNSGEDAGLARAEAYEYQWFDFDNERGATRPLGPSARATSPVLPVPGVRSAYLMARIRTVAPGRSAWSKAVDVFLRAEPRLSVVGVEREP